MPFLRYVFITIPTAILKFIWDIISQVGKNWGRSSKNWIVKTLTKYTPWAIALAMFMSIIDNPPVLNLVSSYLILAGLLYLALKYFKKALRIK